MDHLIISRHAQMPEIKEIEYSTQIIVYSLDIEGVKEFD